MDATIKKYISMDKRENIIPIIKEKNIEWDEIIFTILAALATILPLIFFDYSLPAFTPIKDLSLQILSLLGLTVWILRIISTGDISWQASTLDMPVFLFLLWGCLSLSWSINVYNTILFLPLFLAGPIIFFIVNNSIREQKSIDRLLLIIIIIGFCFGIYGIFQYYGIDFRVWDRDIGRQRVMGVFGNVNYFAEYLILPLSLTVGLILSKSKTYNRFFLFLTMLTMGVALLFTFTRGSYLAIAFAIPVMLLLYFKSTGNKKAKDLYKKIILLFLLLAIVTLALIYIPHPLNRDNTTLGKLRSRVTIESLTSGESTLRRIAIWKFTQMMIEDYPIPGSGLGTYAYHTLKYQAEFFAIGNNRDIYPHGKAVQAHNEYLQLWSELGIIGLLLFLWIIIVYYRNVFINIKKVDKKQQAIVIALAGGITAVLIDAIFGFPLQLSTTISLFWMFLGLSTCQVNIALQEKRNTISIKKETVNNKKSIITIGKRKNNLFDSKAKKRIAYTITIALMVICMLSLARPFIARVYYYYGEDLVTRINKYNEAIALYEKGIKMNPWLGDLYYKIGINQSARRQDNSALENFHKAEKYMDDHYLPQHIAYLYLRLQEYDKAIPYFEKAIKYQPDKKGIPPLQIQLGNIYIILKDYKNAEYHFVDVIKNNPESAEAYYGLAIVHLEQGKKEQAVEALEKVIELAPQSEVADNARTKLTDFEPD